MTMQWQSNGEPQFRSGLRAEFDSFVSQQARRFNPEDCLQIDFHCHDHNSDVPDELWGRILRLPETWLKTKQLVKVLEQNGSSVVTVTNHNNARSCWALQDKGVDVLVGCEFTCFFPKYDLFIHVLTYGFTREQEVMLNEKRQNIYDFLRYAARYDIPVILPHPLYLYSRNDRIDLCLFEKLAVMFWRFEVLNGQRDLWQSVLTLNWVQSLTPDRIRACARKHNLDPSEFGVDPDQPKVVTGGSDDHTGIFAGLCGSKLYVPDLQKRLKTESASDLALEALRNGQVAPFGTVGENQKLNIALLDYFSQAATKLKDPGMLRILLHRGSTRDKLGCFVIANLFLEMQKHRKTKKFFSFIHDALHGKKPKRFLKWQASKDYKFCITQLDKIADSKRNNPEAFVDTVNEIIGELFNHLNHLIAKRIRKALDKHQGASLKDFSTEELTRKLEIPSQLTSLFLGDGKRQDNMSNINMAEVLDSLSFPMLISTVLAGSTLASTRVLYQNRDLLNRFARQLGRNEHSRRALCLTDTLLDRNGVSTSLGGKLKEIKRTNLPLDFLICHRDAEPEPHLHVVQPIADIDLHPFGEQTLQVPDVMEIARIFYEGGYDRIVCSTEGPMALVALFLQQMFNVSCYFFMHTDWIDFITHTTDLNRHERDRVRRLMRALYSRFDGVFVLNREHRDWLTGHEMQLPDDRVFLTAHHTAPRDLRVQPARKSDLILGLDLFVFPSRFDTFGNVLLEALTHGMPALAYNCKGPKDIIEHEVSGYLTEDVSAMAEAIVRFFSDPADRNVMAENARNRAARFQAEPIMRQFLSDLGLDYPEQVRAEVTVA